MSLILINCRHVDFACHDGIRGPPGTRRPVGRESTDRLLALFPHDAASTQPTQRFHLLHGSRRCMQFATHRTMSTRISPNPILDIYREATRPSPATYVSSFYRHPFSLSDQYRPTLFLSSQLIIYLPLRPSHFSCLITRHRSVKSNPLRLPLSSWLFCYWDLHQDALFRRSLAVRILQNHRNIPSTTVA